METVTTSETVALCVQSAEKTTTTVETIKMHEQAGRALAARVSALGEKLNVVRTRELESSSTTTTSSSSSSADVQRSLELLHHHFGRADAVLKKCSSQNVAYRAFNFTRLHQELKDVDEAISGVESQPHFATFIERATAPPVVEESVRVDVPAAAEAPLLMPRGGGGDLEEPLLASSTGEEEGAVSSSRSSTTWHTVLEAWIVFLCITAMIVIGFLAGARQGRSIKGDDLRETSIRLVFRSLSPRLFFD